MIIIGSRRDYPSRIIDRSINRCTYLSRLPSTWQGQSNLILPLHLHLDGSRYVGVLESKEETTLGW